MKLYKTGKARQLQLVSTIGSIGIEVSKNSEFFNPEITEAWYEYIESKGVVATEAKDAVSSPPPTYVIKFQ